MHPHISINTLCFAPAKLDTLIDRVVRLGARGISPDLEQVTRFGVSQSARLMVDAGLEVVTLTHRSFAFATPSEATTGRDRLNRTIEIAAEIGAHSITMTTGGRGELIWSDAAECFAEAVAPCVDLARSAGLKLGVEPTSHLYTDASIAHRLSDTVRIVKNAGLSVTVDLFACWFDADIEDAVTEAAPLAALVQVSDYVLGDRSLPCRAVPGDGTIPLNRLIPAIIKSGYQGWFDLEIIGPRLLAEGEYLGLSRAGNILGPLIDKAKVKQQ
jgi:sugar phosphate isomerase/epimerase